MASAITHKGGLPDWTRPEAIQMILLDHIKPHPRVPQPRGEADQEDIDELTENVRACGKVRTPLLVVRGDEPDVVWLIGGHCRCLAAKRAELTHVPCQLKDDAQSDVEIHRAMLLDNDFRKAVRPIDRAKALERHRLMLGENAAAAEVAEDLRMPVKKVEDALELLRLPDIVQPHVNSGAVKLGQARMILQLPPERQESMAAKLVAGTLRPQHLKELVAGKSTGSGSRGKPAPMRGLRTLQRWTVSTGSGKVVEVILQSGEPTGPADWMDALKNAAKKIPISMQLGHGSEQS